MDFIFKIPMIYVYTKQKSIKISEFLSSFCYTIYYFSKINPFFFFRLQSGLMVNEGIWLQQQRYTQLQQLTNWWDTTPCQMTTIPGQLRQNSVPTRQEREPVNSQPVYQHISYSKYGNISQSFWIFNANKEKKSLNQNVFPPWPTIYSSPVSLLTK